MSAKPANQPSESKPCRKRGQPRCRPLRNGNQRRNASGWGWGQQTQPGVVGGGGHACSGKRVWVSRKVRWNKVPATETHGTNQPSIAAKRTKWGGRCTVTGNRWFKRSPATEMNAVEPVAASVRISAGTATARSPRVTRRGGSSPSSAAEQYEVAWCVRYKW